LAEENRFVSFVDNPTSATYDAIVTNLKARTAAHKEWSSFQRDYKALAKFLHLVETSNAVAVDLAIKLAPDTDGGNLEDLCRAVGKNIRPHPELVLRVLRQNQLGENGQRCMLDVLPSNTVDNIDAQIGELAARVAAISVVNNPELSEYKRKALTILDDDLHSLRNVKSELKNSH